jgi:hypothetical protein
VSTFQKSDGFDAIKAATNGVLGALSSKLRELAK